MYHEWSESVSGVTEEYKAVVGLHVLVCAIDLMLNCSLQSALNHLKTVCDKNGELLAGEVLEDAIIDCP